jgi:uncharacterized protein YifE (UPF0438 family)
MAQEDFTLTPEENEQYKKYHKFYEELDHGMRKPKTTAQQHFIDVCHGHAVANTIHEKAYMKDKIFRIKMLEAKSKAGSNKIPEYEEGQARPGLCTDEDVKKARGRQFGETQSIHQGYK